MDSEEKRLLEKAFREVLWRMETATPYNSEAFELVLKAQEMIVPQGPVSEKTPRFRGGGPTLPDDQDRIKHGLKKVKWGLIADGNGQTKRVT